METDDGRLWKVLLSAKGEAAGRIRRDNRRPGVLASVHGCGHGAKYYHDTKLAETAWGHLLQAILCEGNHQGLETVTLEHEGNREFLTEIPWITANFTAQWCLNVIMALDFIREALPKTLHEADLLVSRMPAGNFRKA